MPRLNSKKTKTLLEKLPNANNEEKDKEVVLLVKRTNPTIWPSMLFFAINATSKAYFEEQAKHGF
jgi:hypothetical protein